MRDIVLKVGGQPIVDNRTLFSHYDEQPLGTVVLHEVWRDGRTLTLAGRIAPFGFSGWLILWWPSLLFGLTCFGMGSFLAWRAAGLPEARAFSYLLGSLSVAAATNNVWDFWTPAVPAYVLAASCAGGLFIQLAQQLGPSHRHRPWPMITSLALALVGGVMMPLTGSAFADGHTIAWHWLLSSVAFVYWPLAAGALVFPAMVALNLRGRQRHEMYYLQNRLIIWSAVAAFMPVLMVWLLPGSRNSVNSTLANASFISLTILPAGTFLAVLRYQLFALDLVLRRTLTYTLTISLLALIYTGTVATIAHHLSPRGDETARFVLVMVLALIVEPVRRRVSGQVDRWFDHGRLSILDVQRMIVQRAAEHRDTSQTLDGIVHDVRDSLRLTHFAIALPYEDCLWVVAGSPELLGQAIPLTDVPNQRHWHCSDSPGFPWPDGIVAGYAVTQRDRLLGVMLLGEHAYQEPLTSQDWEYLGLIAGQLGLLLSYAQVLERQDAVDREMQSLLKKVSELNDLRASFGVVAGHEMRTPLQVIRSHAEALMAGDFGDLDAYQSESVRSIFESATLMSRHIAAYLDLIALRENRLFLRPATCDIASVVVEALESLHDAIADNDLALELDVAPALTVRADPRRLQQVFEQLLSNAVTFTPKGGSIRVWAQDDGSTVLVGFQDSGPGIPPEALANAFTEFGQVAEPSQRDVGGLGLGLPLAKALTEAMAGTLSYESGQDGGAIFTCAFPAALAETGPLPPRQMDLSET